MSYSKEQVRRLLKKAAQAMKDSNVKYRESDIIIFTDNPDHIADTILKEHLPDN